ncbi:MAG: hypothetical protein HOQ24_10945 [Mycobacteriaceae bacterium]|nr:hypothetical protein [Mycobacteriaceae bacterium]
MDNQAWAAALRDSAAMGAANSWLLNPADLSVLWPPYQFATVPDPFIYTNVIRHRYPLPSDPTHVFSDVRMRLGASFEQFVRALHLPEVRVVVNAWDLTKPEDPRGRVRVLGVRAHGHSYVVRQLPGNTPAHTGYFVMTEHSDLALAKAVVKTLPSVPAGSIGRTVLTSGAQATRILTSPKHRVGTIEIYVGNGPSQCGTIVSWCDVVDDGRYLLASGDTPQGYGIDPELMIRMLHALFGYAIRSRMARQER